MTGTLGNVTLKGTLLLTYGGKGKDKPKSGGDSGGGST